MQSNKIMQLNLPEIKHRNYPIIFTQNYISSLLDELKSINIEKIIVISDNNVANLYLNSLVSSLEYHGYKIISATFHDGEEAKNTHTKEYIEKIMFTNACNKNTICIALGGGVVGDLTGFIAATYMRGIKYIQIPTTLLAMVDSSIGGKTGVNTDYGKNLIGAIYQPHAVIIDTIFLKTLELEQFCNGLFEIIKAGLITNQNLFQYIKDHLNKILKQVNEELNHIIYESIKIKANIVTNDEFEQNIRMTLNFGHTVGHAIEASSKYTILHGYAIALGMLIEIKIAEILGFIDKSIYSQVYNLLSKLDCNTQLLQQITIEDLIYYMLQDKKNNNQTINMVILSDIGNVHTVDNKYVHAVDIDIIKQAYSQIIMT